MSRASYDADRELDNRDYIADLVMWNREKAAQIAKLEAENKRLKDRLKKLKAAPRGRRQR